MMKEEKAVCECVSVWVRDGGAEYDVTEELTYIPAHPHTHKHGEERPIRDKSLNKRRLTPQPGRNS